MKNYKKLFACVLLICLLITTIGCTKQGEEAPKINEDKNGGEEKKVTIGFIPMTLDNEFFITMVNAAKQEAEKIGVELLIQAGEKHVSAEEQLQLIENMISNKVDAICIVPSSPEGLMTALKKAEEAKIPVINLDAKLDEELVKSSGLKPVPFIGTDNYDGAKLAGEFALELMEGKANVAILTGIAGQQNAADRRDGFYDVVKDKFNIVAEQSADWEVEKGYNIAQNILQANKDIDLIFAGNDGMALGAMRAIKEIGKDIKVIGFDAINEALNSVAKDEMVATVAQFPAKMGIEGVKMAKDIIDGKNVQEDTDTGTEVITKDKVEEFKKYLDQYK